MLGTDLNCAALSWLGGRLALSEHVIESAYLVVPIVHMVLGEREVRAQVNDVGS